MAFRFQGLRFSTLRSTMVTLFPRLNSQATWDSEYARGDWETLNSDDEFARYAVILGHVLRLPARAALLDVGCGSGRLLELTSRIGVARYLGTDLSAQAIERARQLQLPNADFTIGSAESFSTEERFDAIVFNEVAYYLKSPGDVLLRYHQYLRPGGILIVSMFDSLPASLAWRTLSRTFDSIESTRVVNGKKRAWDIRLLRPKLG
jgi:2-polyprenyl-3-methyl-5-hydroxy-6-metoxy-1,4-benzoquinol methylase